MEKDSENLEWKIVAFFPEQNRYGVLHYHPEKSKHSKWTLDHYSYCNTRFDDEGRTSDSSYCYTCKVPVPKELIFQLRLLRGK